MKSIDFSLDILDEVDKVFPGGEESILDRLSIAKELAECLARQLNTFRL